MRSRVDTIDGSAVIFSLKKCMQINIRLRNAGVQCKYVTLGYNIIFRRPDCQLFNALIFSTVDVHKQFIGFQKGKACTVTKCSNGPFDEDKKKKIIRQRRKNGQKKGDYVLLTLLDK